MDLYIYYKVCIADTPLLYKHIKKLQTKLSQEYGIVGALKKRPGEGEGMQTWMEIYYAVPGEFADIVERYVDETKLATLIQGSRHVEHFVDLVAPLD